jgi:glycosyltransferase involved in cell wall biosynthesis
MKIMAVMNNPEKFEYQPTKSSWNLFPSLLMKRGQEVLCIGKSKLSKFYSEYLRFKPDIIKIDWVPSSLIPPIFKKLGLVKCPIVMDWTDYYVEMMTNYPRFIVKFMEEFSVKNADFITTSSRRNEKRAKEMGKRVLYIPFGYFKENKKTKINLDKVKTRKNNLKIIYLGDQSRWKKVDEIIKACMDIECDLFLLGTINPEFQSLAKDYKNVHFMGRVDELEVRSVLKQADILVNTSNQDSNYKFFEYIHAGKSILAYDGYPANILTHKKNAYLTKDFKEGLKELIRNKRLRTKLEKNVKKINTYNWDKIADMHINLYKRLVLENN